MFELIFNLLFKCKEIIKYIYEMSRALSTLKEEKIIHRDIKGKNILIANNGSFKLSYVIYLIN
jgi:serine/threonine protein kinase